MSKKMLVPDYERKEEKKKKEEHKNQATIGEQINSPTNKPSL